MCRHSTTVFPSLLLSSLSLLLPFVCSIQGERVPVSPLRSIPLCCKSWTWHVYVLWSQKMTSNCLSYTDRCLWLSIVAIPLQSQLHKECPVPQSFPVLGQDSWPYFRVLTPSHSHILNYVPGLLQATTGVEKIQTDTRCYLIFSNDSINTGNHNSCLDEVVNHATVAKLIWSA